MKTSTRSDRRITAKQRERQKRFSAFKTAVPLVLTLLLLAVVYVLVLLPDSPETVLKRGLYNSLDQSKQKSWRYDGTFGDKDSGLAGEYSSQKASNGDEEFFIKVSAKDASVSYHSIHKGADTYYLVSGTDSIPTVLSVIPGAKTPDQTTLNLLANANNKWVQVSSSNDPLIRKLIPCSDKQPIMPTTEELKRLTDKDMPIEITGGPYSANDGSQSRVYEVGIKKGHQVLSSETSLTGYIECLDSLRGDDFKLRKVNSQDIDAMRFNITIDPLSNTMSRVVYKQFSQYFQFNIRDYNKDVSVRVPEGSISLSAFFAGLDEQTKQDLIAKTALSL